MPNEITIHVNEVIGVDNVKELCGDLEAAQIKLGFQEHPNQITMALEWLLPTGVVFFMAKKYFETLAEESARDHYSAIKKFFAEKIQPRLLGPNAKKMITMIPGGKVRDTGPFSRTFSIATKLSNANTSIDVTLLFKENADPEEVNDGMAAFTGLLASHEEDNLLLKLIEMDQGRAWNKVVWFNPEIRKIELIDAVQSHKEKRLIATVVE